MWKEEGWVKEVFYFFLSSDLCFKNVFGVNRGEDVWVRKVSLKLGNVNALFLQLQCHKRKSLIHSLID